MDSALSVQSLSKSYSDFTLRDVDFTLPLGYIMGLIGPNGSGKTTTIRCILNMVRPDRGRIDVFGRDHIACEQQIKENIGVVFDSSFFVDEWKMDDVEKAYALFYAAWDGKKFFSLLSRFSIGREKRVKELSKGMQMKLMLACAFSYDAALLILDEPTSGLDPVSRDELLSILAEYIQDGKHSVLFSTHITSDLERIADYITYLHLGEMVFTGEKERFIDGYRILRGGAAPEASLEEKLIGLSVFATGYEALIRTEDLPPALRAASGRASIEEIVVFMGRQSEKEGRR